MTIRTLGALCATLALAACGGGNPFATTDGETGTGTETTIPDALASDVDSISYDATAKTLTITGLGLDDTPFTTNYTRKPSLDRGGYEAYTVQDSSLNRHVTAYVRQIEGGYAVAVATGGQFSHYMAGTNYGRTGTFTAPTTDQPSGGIVSYMGTYVGLLNMAGDGGDLLPVAPGTAPDITPYQAAEVTGNVLINADFADNRVEGSIYNRSVTDDPTTTVETLNLVATDISDTGTFDGTTTVGTTTVGEYGGIFSGTDAASVAGSIHAGGHITAYGADIEEYGIFVLGQCGGANSDPACTQPVP